MGPCLASSNRRVEMGIECRTPGYKTMCFIVVDMKVYVFMFHQFKKVITAACLRYGYSLIPTYQIIQEVFRVYLNKFENAVTHLYLIIFGNNWYSWVSLISRNTQSSSKQFLIFIFWFETVSEDVKSNFKRLKMLSETKFTKSFSFVFLLKDMMFSLGTFFILYVSN